jgi:hypothetical protein
MTHLRKSPILVVLAVAACTATDKIDPSTFTVDQLISAPETYEGKVVTVDSCLFVTRHGMSLYNCNYRHGESDQLISFNPLVGVGERTYMRLVDLGHKGFTIPKFEVRANITGVYVHRESGMPRYELLVMGASNVRKLAQNQ